MDDILVGTRLGGVRYFVRLVPGGILLEYSDSLMVDGKPLDVGHNSAPAVAHWNGDLLPDLLVGRMGGIPASVYLFVNEGTAGDPLFTFTDTVRCDGEPIQIYLSHPDFHDMNLDGLDDLVVGSDDGMARCFLNVGSPGSPLFEDVTPLLHEDGQPVKIFGAMRSVIADWNDDGIPDIVTGDAEGFVSWFPGIAPQSAGEPDRVPEPLLTAAGNPASGVLELVVHLSETSRPVIDVFDLTGRLLRSVSAGYLQAGSSSVTIDLTGIPCGVLAVRCTLPGGGNAALLVTLL
jgi:hypothetical protein